MRHEERVTQYKINRMFAQNLYQQMDGIRNINNERADAEESKQFWINIRDNEKEHERNAGWLRELRAEKDNIKQNDINKTTIRDDKRTSQKDPELEEPDGVQGYWLKKLTLHKYIAKRMDNIISNREDIPKWMTLSKTVLCQKDPSKGSASN